MPARQFTVLMLLAAIFAESAWPQGVESYEVDPTFGEAYFARMQIGAGSRFTFEYDGFGLRCKDQGSMSVNGETLSFHVTACAGNFGVATCRQQNLPTSPFFSRYLVCQFSARKGSLAFGAASTRVAPGSRRSIDNYDVVTLGLPKGKTSTGVKLREGPSTSAKEKPFQPLYATAQPFVPENTVVTIVARTIEKHKVADWKNYWYYVILPGGSGWMFAEFIKAQ